MWLCPTGELGLADEYSARVEIEVDSPGPSRVIHSIPLRARSGTARVHAPKDLQVARQIMLRYVLQGNVIDIIILDYKNQQVLKAIPCSKLPSHL